MQVAEVVRTLEDHSTTLWTADRLARALGITLAATFA
jgi:hypothetical protein